MNGEVTRQTVSPPSHTCTHTSLHIQRSHTCQWMCWRVSRCVPCRPHGDPAQCHASHWSDSASQHAEYTKENNLVFLHHFTKMSGLQWNSSVKTISKNMDVYSILKYGGRGGVEDNLTYWTVAINPVQLGSIIHLILGEGANKIRYLDVRGQFFSTPLPRLLPEFHLM